MPDTFVQDILDPEELEKRDVWNKRLDLPILVSLDEHFQKEDTSETLLSGEFVHKINPDAYRIDDNCIQKNSNNSDPVTSFLVDGTGYRNNIADNVLPSDELVISRKKYDNLESFYSKLKSVIEISFSDKGIGKRTKDQDFGFSKDHPFYIFVCAYNDNELRQYMDEVLANLKDFPENLVKVVGFLVPKVG